MIRYTYILLFLLSGIWANAQPWIILGEQTTSQGIISYGTGIPDTMPTGELTSYAYADTTNQKLYLFSNNEWHLSSLNRSSTAPLPSETSGSIDLTNRRALWLSLTDDNTYYYSEELDAWVPLGGIWNGATEPTDAAATGSTGAVTYTASFWRDTDDGKIYQYTGSAWEELGGGENFFTGSVDSVYLASGKLSVGVSSGEETENKFTVANGRMGLTSDHGSMIASTRLYADTAFYQSAIFTRYGVDSSLPFSDIPTTSFSRQHWFGIDVGKYYDGGGNAFFGSNVGRWGEGGTNNWFGFFTGAAGSGSGNTFMGTKSFYQGYGNDNFGFGEDNNYNLVGDDNISIGWRANIGAPPTGETLVFDSTGINLETEKIYLPAHGLTLNRVFIAGWSSTGTFPSGFWPQNRARIEVTDADSVQIMRTGTSPRSFSNMTDKGDGTHTLTIDKVINKSIAIGHQAAAQYTGDVVIGTAPENDTLRIGSAFWKFPIGTSLAGRYGQVLSVNTDESGFELTTQTAAGGGGTIKGSGTINTVPIFAASDSLSDSNLSQSANAITLAAQKGLELIGGTTAQRPAGTAGLHWYNTDDDLTQFYDGTSWQDLLTQSSGTAQGLGSWTNASGTIHTTTNLDKVVMGFGDVSEGVNALTVNAVSSGISGIAIKGAYAATSQAGISLITRLSGVHIPAWQIYSDIDTSLVFRNSSDEYLRLNINDKEAKFGSKIQKTIMQTGLSGDIGFRVEKTNAADWSTYEFRSGLTGSEGEADIRYNVGSGLQYRDIHDDASAGRHSWWTNISGTIAERMRLTNNGALLVGTTSQTASELLNVNGGAIITGGATLGNYVFNTDQPVGPSEDGYNLKYNDASGEIELGLGGLSGAGTANTLPLWATSNTLGDSYLSQSATTLTLAALKALAFSGGTTAQRPTGSNGLLWYNTSNTNFQWYDGAAWNDISQAGLNYWTKTGDELFYTGQAVTVTGNAVHKTLELKGFNRFNGLYVEGGYNAANDKDAMAHFVTQADMKMLFHTAYAPSNIAQIFWHFKSNRTSQDVRINLVGYTGGGTQLTGIEIHPYSGQFLRGTDQGRSAGFYTTAAYTQGQDVTWADLTDTDNTEQRRKNLEVRTQFDNTLLANPDFSNIESGLVLDNKAEQLTLSVFESDLDYDTSYTSDAYVNHMVFSSNGNDVGKIDKFGGIDFSGGATLGNYVFNTDQTVGASEDEYVLTYDDDSGEIELAPKGIPSPVYGEAFTSGAFREYDLTSSNVIDTLTAGDLDGVTYADGELTFDDLGTAKFFVQYSVSLFGSFTTNNTIISRLRKNNSTLYNQGGEARATIGNQAGGANRTTLSGSMIIELSSGNDMSIELSALTAVDITVEHCSFSIRKIN